MVASVFDRSAECECYYESDPEAFDHFVLRGQDVVTHLVRKSRAEVVLFKSILNSQNARALLDSYEGSKAIWLFRPYPDVVNSNLKRFKSHFKDLDEMLNAPDMAGWRVENVPGDDIELIRKYHGRAVSDASARALLWYLRNRLLFHQQLDVDSRVLIANYDNIVTNPKESFARIFSFFDLQFRPQYVSGVQATSVRRDPAPDIDPEITELCENMFSRLRAIATF